MGALLITNCINKCLGIILLVCSLPILHAQKISPRFEHLSVEDGLSQRYVFGVVTDCRGFLWVSTEGGLNRYDGYEFKTFKHDPDDPQSLGNDVLRQIELSHADGKHRLWVGTVGGGLSSLDLETELFTNYINDPKDTTSLGNVSAWVLEESVIDGTPYLWVGMGIQDALDRFDYRTNEFKHYKIDGLPTAIFQDNEGNLWVGAKGLFRYNPSTDDFTRVTPPQEHDEDTQWYGIHKILDDGDGTLWFGSHKGLNKCVSGDRSAAKLEFVSYTHDPDDPGSYIGEGLSYIYEDRHGDFWTALSGKGLSHFDRETERFVHFNHIPDNKHSISSDIMYSMCEDNSDVLWVGTMDGIDKWDRQKSFFTRYDNTSKGPTGLADKWITGISSSMEEGHEILWIGAYGKGLCRLDRVTGNIRWFEHNHRNPNSLVENTVHQLIATAPDELLVAAIGGYSIYSISHNSFKTLYLNQTPGDYSVTYSAHVGPTGRVWLGTNGPIGEFVPEKDSIITYNWRNWGYAIHETRHNDKSILWAGTFNRGLMRLDLETDETIWYRHDPADPSSISSNFIEALYSAELEGEMVLWIGTPKGLDRFDYSTSTFTHYTTVDGLSHNQIASIIEDDNGVLWITTQLGLSRFDPIEESFRTFWKEDGLPGDGFEFETIYKNEAGEIFVGAYDGLASFIPDSLKINPYLPSVVLTDLKLFRETVPVVPTPRSEDSRFTLNKQISFVDEITLKFSENTLSLSFAALDFRSPMKNRYAYFLEGLEKDWNYVDAKHREVTYTSLNPGSYTFRVKGSNNDGVWNNEGHTLAITITPPWWRSNLAYFSYFVLSIGIFTIFYRIRLTQIRLLHQAEIDHLETERYHEIDELKSRFFANISHEFRTPLTLILGPVGKMLTKLQGSEWGPDLNLMQRQAKRLLELVTQLLDLSKLEAGRMQIQVSQRNIIPLLKGLTLSFASMAERDKITLSFNSELEDIQVYVEKDAITKIINNLLSNAFKSTESGGNIQVTAFTSNVSELSTDGEIRIEVRDNGIGISENRVKNIFDRFYQGDDSGTRAREGTGIGLALCSELVELHKGKIQVTSTKGEGTVFTVRLPLGNAHLSEADIVGIEKDLTEEIIDEQIVNGESSGLISGVLQDESPPLLLIVEDNVDVRNYVRSYLDDKYKCYEAVDGEAGLELALDIIPDLIISDVMMPKMDGVEFCHQIKTDERTSHIPVILLTAMADLQSKLDGLETGADEYLTKPFEAEELLVRIKNLIEQRELLRRRFQQDHRLIPDGLNLSSTDEQFLDKAKSIVCDNFQNFDFSVEQFSAEIFMSRQHLNRKLKAVTGRTSLEFIKLLRLKSAAQLLRNSQGSVTEVAFTVGFKHPSQFTKAFQQEYGKTPKAFITKQNK